MPNANGQYRRQTVQEARPAPVPPEREAAPKREEPHAEKCEPQREQPPVRKDCPSNEPSPACRQVQTGLLRGLFPGIDSGDLLLLARESQEYFVYFKIFKPKSWDKRPAVRRR